MRCLISTVLLLAGYVCAQTPRPFRVVRLDPALDDIVAQDAKIETLGEHFGLAVKSDASVYFTDSVCGMRGGAKSPARELPYNHVYRIKDGKVTVLASDEADASQLPNGIVFSPDEKDLYVTAGFGKTMRYAV